MKTIRFYDMMIDCIEDGNNIIRQLIEEFKIELPEDFNIEEAFDLLDKKTGHSIWSFKYENM